jgi:hypothetical protein
MEMARIPVIAVLRENCDIPLTLVDQHRLDARDDLAFGEKLVNDIASAVAGDDSGQIAPSRPDPLPAAIEQLPLPRFHYGSVVPPDFFIDRERELLDALDLVTAGHAFLVVGARRAGKTSFCKKLAYQVMRSANNDILIGSLNLESCISLTIDTFLGHTIINMIGEIARQVFRCKYADLACSDVSRLPKSLQLDECFMTFLGISQQVLRETRYRDDAAPSPFAADQFIAFTTDLLGVIRTKGWNRFVMIFDEANRLPAGLSVELLEENAHAIDSAQLTCVYAASPVMAESFRTLHDYFVNQIRLGPFSSRDDMMHLLARYYCASGPMVESFPITSDSLDLIWEVSQGRPFQLQCILGYSFQLAQRNRDNLVRESHVRAAYQCLLEERPEYFAGRDSTSA